MILDSNIIIYSIQPSFKFLRDFIALHNSGVSEITRLEVLGYHKISNEDKQVFHLIFDSLELFNMNKSVVEKAISLRQQKSMSLGDSLIAATAIVHNLPLMTRNKADFIHIKELTIINPFENQ